MTTIETDRLTIRNFGADDWRGLREVAEQYRASEYAKYDHQWPTTVEEIKRIVAWFAAGDRHLAVCLKATGKLIGFVALSPGAEEGQIEFGLGYVFHTDYHGKGYATEACRAILGHAFRLLTAHRVVSSTAAANHASCQLLRRLGMRETGQRTVSFAKTPDGEPIEFVALSFAISRGEWETLTRASTRSEAQAPGVSRKPSPAVQ
jgi:RimJ/RimL family protein N-acetyltransferase